MLGSNFESDPEMPHLLRLVSVRTQGQGEEGLQILDRNVLAILHLDTLGAVTWNGNDTRAECLAPARLRGRVLALLQQAGVDRLPLQPVVNLFRAPPFEDYARNARHIVPNGEIGNCRAARKRK